MSFAIDREAGITDSKLNKSIPIRKNSLAIEIDRDPRKYFRAEVLSWIPVYFNGQRIFPDRNGFVEFTVGDSSFAIDGKRHQASSTTRLHKIIRLKRRPVFLPWRKQNVYTFGRSRWNDIVVDAPGVASRHGHLVVTEDSITVIDFKEELSGPSIMPDERHEILPIKSGKQPTRRTFLTVSL